MGNCYSIDHIAFGLLYVSCVSGFEGEMWDLIVLVPEHCFSFNYSSLIYQYLIRDFVCFLC